jgi:hypothetical protein
MSATILTMAQVRALVAARARGARVAEIAEELACFEVYTRAEVVGEYLTNGWATEGEIREALDVLTAKENAR